MNLKHLCQQTCQIVTNTASFLRSELGKVSSQQIETKSLNSLVSYVDKQAEIQLVNGLKEILPDSTFLTEEETVVQEKGEYLWIIDPLDGTTNFLHQIPTFSVSVALQHQGATILGVVYEVNREECFYAWKGGGAFLNEKSISVSQTTKMQDSLVATGFPYYDYKWVAPYLEVLRYCMFNTRGIRRIGSAAVDLAYVACGRFDAYFEYSLSPWDLAAGAFIVQEAGGLVTDFQGGDNYLYGKELMVGNPLVFDELAKVVKDNFYPVT